MLSFTVPQFPVPMPVVKLSRVGFTPQQSAIVVVVLDVVVTVVVVDVVVVTVVVVDVVVVIVVVLEVVVLDVVVVGGRVIVVLDVVVVDVVVVTVVVVDVVDDVVVVDVVVVDVVVVVGAPLVVVVLVVVVLVVVELVVVVGAGPPQRMLRTFPPPSTWIMLSTHWDSTSDWMPAAFPSPVQPLTLLNAAVNFPVAFDRHAGSTGTLFDDAFA